MSNEDHIHNPGYSGQGSGIRCLTCNTAIDPDPRVGRTAASPSPNHAAIFAAVAVRGAVTGPAGDLLGTAPTGGIVSARFLLPELHRTTGTRGDER